MGMRVAGYDSSVILMPVEEGSAEERPVGVMLTGSGCAEQEYGVQDIKDALGILPDASVIGIDSWTMCKGAPSKICAIWHDDGMDFGLIVTRNISYEIRRMVEEGTTLHGIRRDGSIVRVDEEGLLPADVVMIGSGKLRHSLTSMEGGFTPHLEIKDKNGRISFRKPRNKVERELLVSRTSGIKGLWSDEGFAVLARGDEAKAAVLGLREALLDGRLALGLGNHGRNPFSRGGLSIIDRGAVPQYFVDDTNERDREYRKLQSAFKATDIEKYLELGKKRLHGIKPKWIVPSQINGLQGLVKEEESLVFYVNPYDQETNSYGWYNLHELEAWAEGEDNVPNKYNEKPNPDWQERLREHLDPRGYEAAQKAAEDAGLNMDWKNLEPIAFALRPFLCDGNVLGKGTESILWLNPKKQDVSKAGWFTAAEVKDWIAGIPSPINFSAHEMEKGFNQSNFREDHARTLEEAMEALHPTLKVMM